MNCYGEKDKIKTVFVLCGKPGSGKTTLAKYISDNYMAIPFSLDKFMIELFGEIPDRAEFDAKLNACSSLIYDISDEILRHANVVFDFGFWTKESRKYIKERFKHHKVVIIYMKVDDEINIERLKNRNNNSQSTEFYIDRDKYKILASKFEEPEDTEEYILYKDEEQLKRMIDE